MSIFNPEAAEVTTPAEATNEENVSFLAKVVELKGEKFADPEELAKSVLHATSYIEELKRQQDELQVKLEKASSVDQLLAALQQKNAPKTEEVKPQPPAETPDIRALVAEELSKHQQQSVAEQNLNSAISAIQQNLGDNYQAVVSRTMKELGLTQEYVEGLAKTSPAAVVKLFTGNTAPNPTVANIKGGVNTSAMRPKVDTLDSLKEELRATPKLANDKEFISRWAKAAANR